MHWVRHSISKKGLLLTANSILLKPNILKYTKTKTFHGRPSSGRASFSFSSFTSCFGLLVWHFSAFAFT